MFFFEKKNQKTFSLARPRGWRMGGEMAEILVVGRDHVRQILTMAVCIDLMAQAFRAASDGSAVQGLRGITKLPDAAGGLLGVMPAGLTIPPRFGVKVISVLHGRAAQSHQGGVLLFDTADYSPLALIHAGDITGIRTAAATAVATRTLARANSRRLVILGTGEQAETHLGALCTLQSWDEIRIWGRTTAKAEHLAAAFTGGGAARMLVCENIVDAMAGADVVCTVTAAAEPIITAAMIEPGMHLNLVGASVPWTREAESGVMAQGRIFTDHAEMARTASGDFLMAVADGTISPTHLLGELGAVLLGRIAGRTGAQDVTIFKSIGMPVEDLLAANYIYAQARADGLGTRAPF